MDQPAARLYPVRRWFLISLFVTATLVLLGRAVELQVLNGEFLRQHGDARALRVVSIPAHRGMITDRNGEPIAISTPVDSIWVNPGKALQEKAKLDDLAAALSLDAAVLPEMLGDRIGREFVYLKRHVTPDQARAVQYLDIAGVHMQREYKRYYPAGEITAHLVGFTNVDDTGQEGAELAFDHWLRGEPGSKRVLRDRLGRTVQDVESISPPDPGRTLELSIDRRIQYLAYRELKAAVAAHRARSGLLVMLDPRSGEVMAMAVQPSYNPNSRSGLKSDHYRNRAATDSFEPGSTLKPFTIAAALESGLYEPDTIVETGPGLLRVSDHTIHDVRNFGTLTVTDVIRKSSNVGAGRIALALGPRPLWDMFGRVGFGRHTGSGFPGEAAGQLHHYQNWSEVELATIAFGHGISTTALQLAQAFAVIASDGILRPVSIQRIDGDVPGERVMPAPVARTVMHMMEAAVQPGGTGQRAAINGYRIAGKTGTAHKAVAGGYAENRYRSLFAGIAPASDPALVLVIVIDEPQGAEYFGGQVAAPVFARVMRGALRILGISPDNVPSLDGTLMAAESAEPVRAIP